MDTIALKTTISNERKLVERNWLFRLSIFGLLAYALYTYIPLDFHYISWEEYAFVSSIPLQGVYFFNLYQSLIIAFIICDIRRKQRKSETRDTLSVRPVSNALQFLGEFIGIFIAFLKINILFMVFSMIFHLFMPDSPFNFWIYLFYFFTHTIPTILFITGLSLFVNKMIKFSLISWITLMFFFYFEYNYLRIPLNGILDFWGRIIPNSFSNIIGHVNLSDYLLHRGTFLLLGISFLYFTPLFIKRIPNTPSRKLHLILPASLFLIFGLGLGYAYIHKFQTLLKNRDNYHKAFLKYDQLPKARVTSHDIVYWPEGKKFSATSHLTIQNQKKIKIEQLLLYLNPGLKINKIESNVENIPFERDLQAIIIDHPLAPGENIELKIEYDGNIDENIYEINLPKDRLSYAYMHRTQGFGRNFAFLSEKMTLLIPEIIWYPTTVAPVKVQSPLENNFTDYTLHVKNTGESTVLSQGTPTKEDDGITFKNSQNLTGLTLCIGEYEKRTITIDSVTIELYTSPKNNFFMKYFDEWEPLKKENPEREKKLAKLFEQCKAQVESGKPIPYPFKYFKLIEIPISFVDSKLGSGSSRTQPEIVLFEERMIDTWPYPFIEKYANRLSGTDPQELFLNETLPQFFTSGFVYMEPLFTEFAGNLTSDTYPGIGEVFNKMNNITYSLFSPFYYVPEIKAFNLIVEKGVKKIITGTVEQTDESLQRELVIELKAIQLLSYLTTFTSFDSLSRFIQEFSSEINFQERNFDSFIERFGSTFGHNITEFMNEWYTNRQIPNLLIKDVSCKKGKEMQIIRFKVGNFSDADGIVSLIASSDKIKQYRSYLIKRGECKEITLHEPLGNWLTLTTNYSKDRPRNIKINLQNEPYTGDVPEEEIISLDKSQFFPPNEIIVDNEDENFHLIDSANNRKRLSDFIKTGNKQEYGFKLNTKSDQWDLPYISYSFYGTHIHSAYTKEVGKGKCKAEWTASLPEAGIYELFVYQPHFNPMAQHFYTTDKPGVKYYYTVDTPDGEQEIILQPQGEDSSWISLGMFSLPAGKSRIVLDDRGVPPFESGYNQYFQLIVADAVKWVKKKSIK